MLLLPSCAAIVVIIAMIEMMIFPNEPNVVVFNFFFL